jgi:hypothetical protein
MENLKYSLTKPTEVAHVHGRKVARHLDGDRHLLKILDLMMYFFKDINLVVLQDMYERHTDVRLR